MIRWLARRERDTTVTHEGSGYAVPTYRREVWVPADLSIKVGVQIDKARAYHKPRCVDFSSCGFCYFTNVSDNTIFDPYIPSEGVGTGAINDFTVANSNVK